MIAFWLFSGLFVATFAAAGALMLGTSLVVALMIYSGAGSATLVLGLVACLLDQRRAQTTRPSYMVPAE